MRHNYTGTWKLYFRDTCTSSIYELRGTARNVH